MEGLFYSEHLESISPVAGAAIHNAATIGVVLNSARILWIGDGNLRPKFYLLHDIPGRLRFHIPALRENQNYEEIKSIFSSLKGIQHVRIEPIIQTMLIQYKSDEISRNHLLRCVSFFFQQQPFNPLDSFMSHVKPTVRRGLFRSLIRVVYYSLHIFENHLLQTNCLDLLRSYCNWLCCVITWNEQ